MATRASDPTLELLRNRIRTLMNDVTDHIADNGCIDFADYRFCTGRIRGLAEAESRLLEVDEMLTRQDESIT